MFIIIFFKGIGWRKSVYCITRYCYCILKIIYDPEYWFLPLSSCQLNNKCIWHFGFLGPKQNTLNDFWTMIWQEKVTQIVMLTNLKEGVKVSYCLEHRKKIKIYWSVLLKCFHKDFKYLFDVKSKWIYNFFSF